MKEKLHTLFEILNAPLVCNYIMKVTSIEYSILF
jgi:hypothetical protein